MKIFVLTKRQYMGKDLLNDRFGRFRELPLELARLGAEVRGLAVSYRPREESVILDSDVSGNGRVRWHSINVHNRFIPRFGRMARHAMKLATDFKPDVVWACSDAYHAIFGAWLAKRIRTRCVVDLYDNFEAFRASQLPGVLPLFRRAVKQADGVTCFSKRLADHVTQTYARKKPTAVTENGIRKDLFYPRARAACRQRLGLPQDAKIIGTAGALDSSRDIKTLFETFELLSAEYDDLCLALAGPRERGLQIPRGPRIHDLNVLPHEKVPSFINSLDLAIVCYRQSAQGEFSFPQKAYEIIACRVPLIAAAVGTMKELLRAYPGCLYEPERPQNLASAVRRQLKDKVVVEAEIPSWADSAKQLYNFFAAIVPDNTTGANTRSTIAVHRQSGIFAPESGYKRRDTE
jgi:teichuronic acid biosynthesis glycosyltransferase TuaC